MIFALGVAIYCGPANAQSSDNACSVLTGLAMSRQTAEPKEMERYADPCSGNRTADGAICRHVRDLLQQKGEPYGRLAKRI
jgi:hypothetical protein